MTTDDKYPFAPPGWDGKSGLDAYLRPEYGTFNPGPLPKWRVTVESNLTQQTATYEVEALTRKAAAKRASALAAFEFPGWGSSTTATDIEEIKEDNTE